MTPPDKILILDFGSQTTQLIARRIREARVYSEIYPCHAPLEAIRAFQPKGIVLSGGPASVYDPDAPFCSQGILELGVPVLGICYGMQWLTHVLGGRVGKAQKREYGRAELVIDEADLLFRGIGQKRPEGRITQVWMSHGDRIERPPRGWRTLAHTANAPTAAMGDVTGRFFGVQFHPEVVHTLQGADMLKNFAYRICGCRPTWTMHAFAQQAVEQIRETVGKGRVLCALSGGVDSSVVAVLVHRAVGKQLTCIFVDNGLLRKGEARSVVQTFRKGFRMNLRVVDAADRFLARLRGVADPERKRRIIGREFIRLFEQEAKRVGQVDYLAQGTLYPDVIESVSFRGPSVTIKTHHNVGGLPTRMRFKLIEPLRELFKDEVRELGRELGLPEEILWRQPFPGPGLAIRILGPVTRERLEILREADAIVLEEIRAAGLYRTLWQSFAVLLPVRTVGVMGDVRTYENVIAIRAVTSQDGMTADWAALPHDLLGRLANRIINEVRGVNRVVYDISSKPPSTIEWE